MPLLTEADLVPLPAAVQRYVRGEGIWHPPAGDYSYLRFHLDAIEYNVP